MRRLMKISGRKALKHTPLLRRSQLAKFKPISDVICMLAAISTCEVDCHCCPTSTMMGSRVGRPNTDGPIRQHLRSPT